MEEKVLIIIPAYNEEESILNTYSTILEYNKTHTRQLDTIVINDGSTDNTENILVKNKIPHIKLIHNLGIGGGQKQRVAIARALVNDPKILLCDEATSALDPRITHGILELLKQINEELGITIVVVTHQMEVVKQICQRVAFLKHGVVLAEGKPEELFVKPTEDVKKFLGEEGQALPKAGVNVQLFFTDDSSDEPVITEMARELGIDFSICWAKLEEFRENVFGSLILNIQEKDKERVFQFLESKNVTWEVL